MLYLPLPRVLIIMAGARGADDECVEVQVRFSTGGTAGKGIFHTFFGAKLSHYSG